MATPELKRIQSNIPAAHADPVNRFSAFSPSHSIMNRIMNNLGIVDFQVGQKVNISLFDLSG